MKTRHRFLFMAVALAPAAVLAQSQPPPPPFGLGADAASGFYPNLEELGGLYQLDVFARMAQHRLKDIRDTRSTARMAAALPVQVASSGSLDGLLSGGGINESGLSVYFNGDLSRGRKDGSDKELGARFRLHNGLLGGDKRFGEYVAGMTLGTGRGRATVDADAGTLRSTMTVLGGYVNREWGDWYGEGLLLAGRNRFHINRRIDVGGVQHVLPSSPSGSVLSASVSGGRNWVFDAASVTAYARLQQDVLRVGAVSERGNSGYELSYGKQTYKSLKAALGVSALYNLSTAHGVFIPTASLEWVHEFQRDARIVQGSLVADPRIVVQPIQSDEPSRNYGLLSLGVSGVLPDGWAVFANFDSTLFMKRFQRHSLILGVRKEL